MCNHCRRHCGFQSQLHSLHAMVMTRHVGATYIDITMDAADMSINSDEAHKNQLDYQA